MISKEAFAQALNAAYCFYNKTYPLMIELGFSDPCPIIESYDEIIQAIEKDFGTAALDNFNNNIIFEWLLSNKTCLEKTLTAEELYELLIQRFEEKKKQAEDEAYMRYLEDAY